MQMFYSALAQGFYASDVHGEDMPADVVEVSLEAYTALMAGQAEGQQIVPDNNGAPELITPVATSSDVTAERNRRAAGGFDFPAGAEVWRFDNDSGALKRITGAATLAGFAMGAGAQAGNYLWHGGADPFSWILSDNQIVQIDAPTMFAVGQVAANWESQHIFAARAIKDLPEIPLDFADDQYWP